MKCPQCSSEIGDDSKFCKECGTNITSLEEARPSFTQTLETPTEALTRGTLFAHRYEIIEELGKGGMGKVYRVEDTKIHEEVALKLIKPEIASDKKTIERFNNELKTARKVAHRNVCKMFDLGEDKGTHFITMEYVPGEDLKSMIRMSGQMGIGTAIRIAKQICSGLSEAHESGIIHRDLKPSNIIIDKKGNARIMDFGIARSLKTKGITGAGVMIGTPEYMSPEQVESKEVDQRSDIYSLGIVLYEMLAGRLPFEGDSPFTVGVKHKSESPRSPKEYNPQISDDLSRIILKCLEKEKESRYQSAGALLSVLEKIEKGSPTTDQVVPEMKPLTSKEITVTFGLKKLLIPAFVIAALAVLIFIVMRFIPQKGVTPAQKIENSIAIISFENLTGDESYDNFRMSIPNLLITNLENAGFSYVVSWERLHDLAKQEGKGDSEFIDSEVGFELCRREGVEALVTGDLNKAGDVFAINLRILDVESKKHIKTANSRGHGIQSLYNQIDQLSRDIAEGIGIDEQRIERAELRIASVTTESLAAYEAYLKGREEFTKFWWREANSSFKKAVELDPSFAMAHLYLSFTYRVLANPEARIEAITKAMELAARATEKERLYIEAAYATAVEDDSEKRYRLLQELVKKYPKEKDAYGWLGGYYGNLGDWEKLLEMYNKALELDPNFGLVHNNLGYFYRNIGNIEKSIEHFERYVSIDPYNPNALDSLADANFWLGRVDEALEKYKEALEVKPDFHLSMRNISYIYAFKEEYDEALRRIDGYITAHPDPNSQIRGYKFKGFYCAWLGRFDESLDYFKQAQEYAESLGNFYNKFMIDWVIACIYVENGQTDLARQHNKIWLPFFIEYNPDSKPYLESVYLCMLALIDLKEGNLEKARSKLAEGKALSSKILDPWFKEWHETFYQDVEGEIILTEGQSDKAIALFGLEKHAQPRLLESVDQMIFYHFPFTRDIVARAYVQKGDLERAIQEYVRLTTFDPKGKSRRLIHPLYYFRAASLYEQKGNTPKASENYEKFLSLWKDADPGHLEVADARERLKTLQ
jgi:tetratricopeptide (TPR) repeat protein/predicted Ser/Thr protein kinase